MIKPIKHKYAYISGHCTDRCAHTNLELSTTRRFFDIVIANVSAVCQ